MKSRLSRNEWNSIFSNYKDKYSNKEISSDLVLILTLIKDFAIYLLLLIPNLLLLLFSFFSSEDDKKSIYFEKVFLEPFKIIMTILNWLFEAPITAYLIVFLVLMYFIEIIYLVQIEGLMNSLMTHQMHFFEGNYYSVLTSIFLHANPIHLGTNCLALLIFGRIVEKEFGFKTLFLFLASGIIANIVSNGISYLQGDLFYSLGASGAIAGMIMFAILLAPLSFTTFFIIPLPIFILGWFLILLDVFGLTTESTTNHLAHLGGYGALLILFFFLELKNRRKILTGFSLNLVLILLLYLASKFFDFSTVLNYLPF